MTSASGKASRNCPHDTMPLGMGGSVAPTMSPISALPPTCCQTDSV